MLIEFFGLPGSGKSTMSRIAVELLQAQGLAVEEVTFDLDHRRNGPGRILAKFAHILRFVAANPFHAIGDVVGVAASGQATLKDGGKAIFNWLFIASVASRKREANHITMLDQGVAQALWSVRFAAKRNAGPNAMLGRAERAAFMPDLVVHVRASLQNVGDRLSARSDPVSRLDKQGRDRQALQRSESLADALIHQLRSNGICVIDVFSDEPGDLATGAARIVDAVMARLSQRHRQLHGWQQQFEGPGEENRSI